MHLYFQIWVGKYLKTMVVQVQCITLLKTLIIILFSGKFDEVFTNLSSGANTSKTFYVFQKYELPDRWHMKNNPRLDGIIYLLAKPSYAFWNSFFQKILDDTSKFSKLLTKLFRLFILDDT